MELIIISRKHGQRVIYYDKRDHDMVSRHTWHVQKIGENYYAVTNTYKEGKKTYKSMHRLIFPMFTLIDHIDGNGLNNSRNNLREATKKENCRNSRVAKNNKSGYKGVSKDGWTNLWIVKIEVNGKVIRGGRFKSKNQAAIKYNKMAKLHFGQYARLNVIDINKEEVLVYENRYRTKIVNK